MADNDNNDRISAGDPSSESGPPGQISGQAAEAELNAYAIERLSLAFETSAKRWELIVYPSLFAFIILAAYGFYLVFSLAKDVHYLAISVDTNMTVLSNNMQYMTDSVGQLSSNVRTMAVSVESMSRDVSTLEPILTSMQDMDQAIQSIPYTMANMRGDMATMNRNIGRPLQFMNWFMPW